MRVHQVGRALIVLLSSIVFAASSQAASTSGMARATIITPVTIAKTDDLNFGGIAAGNAAASITIGTSGTFNCGSGVTCYGSHGPAKFKVNGTAGQSVSVIFDSTMILTASGGRQMSARLTGSADTLNLSPSGDGAISIGGTLQVGANQGDGAYSGTFSISVDYQ